MDPHPFTGGDTLKPGDLVYAMGPTEIWWNESHPTPETFSMEWDCGTVLTGQLCSVLDVSGNWLRLLSPIGVGWSRKLDYSIYVEGV